MGEAIRELDLQKFSYVPSGSVDYPQLHSNLDALEEKINELVGELQRVDARKYTTTRSVLVDEVKPIKLLSARDHKHCQIREAWVTAADNLELDQTIWIRAKGSKNISNPKTIKASEKAGKTQPITVNTNYTINRNEDIEVVSNSTRKVIVSALVVEV